MDMSPVLKTSISDGSGVFFQVISENVVEPYVPNPSKPIDLYDYVITGLLYDFFATEQRYAALNNRLPYVRVIPLLDMDISNERQLVIGTVISSVTDINHSDTVSLACFNEVLLRRFLVNGIASEFGLSIENLINTTPIDQLGRALGDALTDATNGGTIVTISIIKDPKLTISRLTQSDFNVVENGWYSTPETPFFDAFDLVKERVTRQESSLNNAGYVSAVYTDNGGDGSNDTIVFTGEYGLNIKTVSNT